MAKINNRNISSLEVEISNSEAVIVSLKTQVLILQ